MTIPPKDLLSSSGLVIVDKPAGMTSHDVVGKLRRAFSTRRVGHAGTLDPMATGVLIVGLERGTKFLAHMVASTKSYSATIRLGQATTTDDKEGTRISCADANVLAQLDDAAIHDALTHFRGQIMQRPAKVSAIKINGKRAHERVRAGEDVVIPARPVEIMRFEILEIRRGTDTAVPVEHSDEIPPAPADEVGFIDIDVEVDCSSGTYIRSLARDLGEHLNVGGHLTELRRTAVGPFTLDDAQPLDALEENPVLSLSLDESLIRCYPTLAITEAEAADLAKGQWLQPRKLTGVHAAVAPNGQAIALVKEQGKRLASVFVARPSTL
ncbi:MAG: tRNA pseudouridine(55) synthase TruB [Corynebacterium sp.]|uniref:tRNA pseudouridine(55) synthase TruB n=1 Tax=Corynebacterium sp. TaxID=1720 RepID=UPI0026DD9419|nr:tRNA pseudouridine(55) synthase TruB [Corynebacterium sp.]MDO4762565.1 tRNA pseudouridine(55) synthase TruB [Corynebacterium sp.]